MPGSRLPTSEDKFCPDNLLSNKSILMTSTIGDKVLARQLFAHNSDKNGTDSFERSGFGSDEMSSNSSSLGTDEHNNQIMTVQLPRETTRNTQNLTISLQPIEEDEEPCSPDGHPRPKTVKTERHMIVDPAISFIGDESISNAERAQSTSLIANFMNRTMAE